MYFFIIEREEILEAAEKEIQSQKTIAIETEQKMMDDFENLLYWHSLSSVFSPSPSRVT